MNNLEVFQQFSPKKRGENRKLTSNAIIYTRVSTKEQAENNASLETQMKYCMGYAQSNNLNVVQYFGGTYESAKSDEDRKEFNRMLSFVKRKKDISYIIVYSLDRFSRTGSGAMQIKDQLKKMGIGIVAVSQNIDSSTPSGELQENIMFLFSKMDNDLRRNKSVTGMQEKLRKGIWIFGAPVGYSKNYNDESKVKEMYLNEDGKLLRKAFEWKANLRISNLEIIQRLKALGLTITDRNLSNVFKNPFYCGLIVCKLIPGEVIKGNHIPLISKELFLKVNNVLNERYQKSKHKKEVNELPLKRFVACDSCESPYTGYLVKKKNIFYYKCRSKGCKNNINAKKLNNFFMEILQTFEIAEKYKLPLADMLHDALDRMYEDRKEDAILMKSQLTEINKKIEKLEERFAFGEIETSIYNKFREKIQKEKNQIEQKLAETEIKSSNRRKAIKNVLNIGRNINKIWECSTLSQKLTLQNLLFPNGIRYNRKKGIFRTDRVNTLFALVSKYIKGLGENKKGISELSFQLIPSSRGGRIRTCDLLVPNQAP